MLVLVTVPLEGLAQSLWWWWGGSSKAYRHKGLTLLQTLRAPRCSSHTPSPVLLQDLRTSHLLCLDLSSPRSAPGPLPHLLLPTTLSGTGMLAIPQQTSLSSFP